MSAPLQQPGTGDNEVLEYAPEGAAAAQQAQTQMMMPAGHVTAPPLAAPYPLHASSLLSTAANPAAAQDLHSGHPDTAASLPNEAISSYVASQPVAGPSTAAYADPREASPSSASTKILDWQTAVVQSQQRQLQQQYPPADPLAASIPPAQGYSRPGPPVQSFCAQGWPPPPQQQQPAAYSYIQSAPHLRHFGSEGHISSITIPGHGVVSNVAPTSGSSPTFVTSISSSPMAPTFAYRSDITPSSGHASSSPSNHPQVIHFHPPAPAVATLVDRAQAVTPTRPGPIDLNPSRTLLRGPVPQVVQVGEQVNSSFPDVMYAYELPQSLLQPMHSEVPPYPHGDLAVAQTSVSAPLSVASMVDQSRQSSFASWEGMPMAMSSPAGQIHSRFRSASNVRGAPNEAYDGSPARSLWHPHGRMGTMDSMASSQWSPAVPETYRFVDPLQPQVEANPDPAVTWPVSSPVKVARPMNASASSFRRMSSALAPSTVPMISPTTEVPPMSSAASSGQQQQPAMVPTAFFPSYPASESNFFRQGYQQAVEPRGSIASTSTASTNYGPMRFPNHQMYLGENDDPESRRASTATSFSSASLVSPTGGQVDLPSTSNSLAASQLYPNPVDTSQSHLLAMPSSSLGYRGYRDYLLDIHGNPPSATGYPMIFADFQMSKEGSPLSAGPTPSPTGTHTPLPSGSDSGLAAPAPGRGHSVEAPVAQLQRQTLTDNSQPPQTGMPRRKRTLSGRQTLESLPIITVPKPSMAPRSQSANDTLAPSSNSPYRRLSSPVLSVRPSSGDEEALLDEDEDDEEQEAEATFDVTGQGSGDLQFVDTSGSFVNGISPGSSVGYLQLPQASSQASTSKQRNTQGSASNPSVQGGMIPVPATRQPFHPVPESGPVNLVRSLPDDEDDPELGRPRQQKLRFEGDYYTPEWVKGEAAKKEGFCDLCLPGKWLQLKNSAFWYHRQYTHGVSSVSGQPFTRPVSFRQLPSDGATEGLCHQCNTWIMYTTKKQNSSEDESQRVPTNWYKHAHKCHFYMASRTRSEKPRGKRRKVSDSPEP